MPRSQFTPITFENLFLGIKDKGPRTDEKSPNVRSIRNLDVDGNSARPRPGLKAIVDVGKPIIEMFTLDKLTSVDLYIFTNDELFVSNGNGISYGAPVSYGNYDTTEYIDVERYIRETTVLNSGSVTTSKEQFITIGAPVVKEAYTGKILRLTKGADTEDISISLNTTDTIEIDGYIEKDYTGGTYEIFDTEPSVHFTAAGKLYRVQGVAVTDTGHLYDHIGIHAGRLFACRKKDSKVLFTNTQTLYFPRQQEALFDPGDGEFMGFENYFENLVVILKHAIYTIAGQFPEEMIPEKRLSEDVSVASEKSFVVKNGVMYLLTNRGFESFNRIETQSQPEARDISFFLDRERFLPAGLDSKSPMVIYHNRILTQMNGYILVYDTDMSLLLEEHWFGEYDNFNFSCGAENNGTTYFGSGNKIYAFVTGKTNDDDFGDITCSVTGNILEHGQRDIRKLWRNVVMYFTWNDTDNQYLRFTSEGRNIPPLAETRTSDLVDEETFDCGMESPYLIWKMEIRGDFILEDIIFWFKPTSNLYGKSHIT